MPNAGKQFETAIKSACPDGILIYRLKDPAGAFGGSSSLRFSNRNPFDFLMFDPSKRILYALELKTVSGKSISFERTAEDHGEIHRHQIDGLKEWGAYGGVIAGFIIEFRELETTVFLHIDGFCSMAAQLRKKSFRLEDLDRLGIPYLVIPQEKKRTRYRYDIAAFLEEAPNKFNTER